MAKVETIKVAQYLLSKDGKTKYLKFGYGPNADKATVDMVEGIKAALGTDRLFVNLFDDDFRAEYNIQDFVKGNITVPLNDTPQQAAQPAAAPAKVKGKAISGKVDW
jgi:hypothetical protein